MQITSEDFCELDRCMHGHMIHVWWVTNIHDKISHSLQMLAHIFPQANLSLSGGFSQKLHEYAGYVHDFIIWKCCNVQIAENMNVLSDVGRMCSSPTSWKTSPAYGDTPRSSRANPSTTARQQLIGQLVKAAYYHCHTSHHWQILIHHQWALMNDHC